MVVNSPLAELAFICAREIREGLTPQTCFTTSHVVDGNHMIGSPDEPSHLYVGRVLASHEAFDTLLMVDSIVPRSAGFSQTVPANFDLQNEAIFTCAYTNVNPFVFVGYRIPLDL